MLFFFPRGVLGEILNLIESVSEGFPSYFFFYSIVIKGKSKKGHNSINILQNLLKSLTGHLNIYPKLYAKYQNPSLSSSQDILLTFFSIIIMAKS